MPTSSLSPIASRLSRFRRGVQGRAVAATRYARERFAGSRKSPKFGKGVLAINLETTDIEGTIESFLKCKRIVTSSLHGLIIADAYGIPNAWIASNTPKGGEFKYYDYFATVAKFRTVQRFGMTRKPVTVKRVLRSLDFDDRQIEFDVKALLDANPFLELKA